MKMNRTGLLFIVIQFLMTRAKMLERLGSEQFQRAFSFSSLWKKWRCSMNYLQCNTCYHLCYPKLDQDTPHISPSPFNHLKIGSLLWYPCTASLLGAGEGGATETPGGGRPDLPPGGGGGPPVFGGGGGGPAPPAEASPRPEFASFFKESLTSSEKLNRAMWSFCLLVLVATLGHCCTSAWWWGGWWRWYGAAPFNLQKLPMNYFWMMIWPMHYSGISLFIWWYIGTWLNDHDFDYD